MDSEALAAEYVLLGLRFDRLVRGFVDSYTGDPALRRQVAAEPPPDPARLAADAHRLRADVATAELAEPRRQFLAAQLTALECSGRKMAGERVPFVDEVEACFQVTPTPGDPDEYRRVHRELAALLPGRGSLAERLRDLRRLDQVPAERLEVAVRAVSSALRDRVRARFELPMGETVEYRIVSDQPWSGFNHYLGGFRSKVAVNADVGHRASTLPQLVAHEAYPGHHTEHCRKEAGLVQRDQQVEHTVFLINTPQCVLAEGLADLGLHAAVGPGWGPWAAEIFADLGIRLDGELAERVDAVLLRLLPVRQDALLMLHRDGADEADVIAHLQRWLLMPERRARHLVRFMRDPLWRAYTTTYVEGHRLLRRWLDERPASTSSADRYRRLLDEPLVPAAVRAELATRV
ncbi:DUF885 domain-containing protein [Saccharopolyspora hirsuta]|uniref:DUF885 domain-containing protein n=1 Tax=Saccharopolyspora hirsuta TaxID=1837 RepID=A0A5M7C4N8_SACHI|nr:DUF885 domain-containing protein [Saccharopolyspora hirsuta]KAA5837049.1 DUF885 domain-containing protein [Saccharopolyspora hirsuta]